MAQEQHLADSLPFAFLSFSIAKPSWGSSSLTLSLREDKGYKIHFKRIERGVATADGSAECTVQTAFSLCAWIKTLGFYDRSASREIIDGAGTWSLKISGVFPSQEFVHEGAVRESDLCLCEEEQSALSAIIEQHGSYYPDSFPDLLTTMIGLGLPGFEHMSPDAFLADFCMPEQVSPVSALSSIDAASMMAHDMGLPHGFGMTDLQEVIEDLQNNPHQAEAALQKQFRDIPLSEKQQFLQFIQKTDPQNYEWWKRILLG